MSERALLLTITLHEGRYHGCYQGTPDWPPSPARCYQALVAGASQRLDEEGVHQALRWLEGLGPPTIAVPPRCMASELVQYVPNNDLDRKGGDPARLGEVRVPKRTRASILEPPGAVLYVWRYPRSDEESAVQVADLSRGLFQLGRGSDMASATAELLEPEAMERVLTGWIGQVFHPTPGAAGEGLLCPLRGTLDSLRQRYEAQQQRFQRTKGASGAGQVFVQPPRPRLHRVPYDCPPQHHVFELRPAGDETRFEAVPLRRAHDLIIAVRDAAVNRLVSAGLPRERVEGVLVGRRPGRRSDVPQPLRARLVPLPSIGHVQTDPRIRRVLLEVPRGGPVAAEDLRWALHGLSLDSIILVEGDTGMLQRYRRNSHRWRSITPLALPAVRKRTARAGGEAHAAEQAEVSHRLREALRHSGLRVALARVSVCREPLLPNAERAEAFAAPPRFPKSRLWHAEIVLQRSVKGPLILGDGRYLGLGLMVPHPVETPLLAWTIDSGLEPGVEPTVLTRALRRAVMSLAQVEWGSARLPSWISGHDRRGRPASGHHHLHFCFDAPRSRLLIVADESSPDMERLHRSLEGFRLLRAGRAGLLKLSAAPLPRQDPLTTSSRRWRSVTPYEVCRHRKRGRAIEAIAEDVRWSCNSAGLPRPTRVEIDGNQSVPGRGLRGTVNLTFEVAVPGPLLFGRTRHLGGGLFEATADPGEP